ncbi:DUF3991 domain-containing protein [Rhizobium phaseoli]|uniref:DUF3991 domain-containing protein n=1 Tax=Rhizobium phaseoli TaxID=396 RepID=UPI001FCD2DC3|nr:DUF3991 domain-containing protein [Rhizobium phaseoli]
MVRSSVRRERRCVQPRRTSRPRRFFSKAPSGSGLSSGFQTTELEWQPARDDERSALPPPDRWQSRRRPWPGSASSRYLNGERRLPANVPRATINGDLLREAPQGSMWAAHRDQAGVLTDWEARVRNTGLCIRRNQGSFPFRFGQRFAPGRHGSRD